MNHWDDLIVDDEFNIIGRGLVLVINIKRSKLTDDNWVSDVLIKTGDTLTYNNDTYVVKGVEIMVNLLDGKKSSRLGLVVKKID
jgi:hypothetical protein